MVAPDRPYIIRGDVSHIEFRFRLPDTAERNRPVGENSQDI